MLRTRARAALGASLCAALLLAITPGSARAARFGPSPVSVSVGGAGPGPRIPPDFLGLSLELTNLRQIAGYAGGGDLVTLLRSLGTGVLRFGGASADTRIAWTDEATPRPAWASGVLEAGDLRELAKLAEETGWHVILTIGLGHFEPYAAAREAAAAKAALGEWLEAIELGNEPNSYAQHGLRPEPWTAAQYEEQVAVYRGAIEAAAPGVALAGPDVSGSGAFESWGLGTLITEQPVLMTGHHYPLGCEERPPPTIARLLSPTTRRKEGASLGRYMSVALASEVPFRLDEANTVSCGGVAGISNTFASALWAVGYVSQAMSMGVEGINLHGNPGNCAGYTPLCAPTPEALFTGTLNAQPEWYALLLARALVGSRPVASVVRAPARPNVEVRTLLAPDGSLQFVIVDDDPPGARGVAVRLRVGGGFRGASILSLTAPSPLALSGVRLGGRAVAPGGVWSPPATLPRAPNRKGVIAIDLRPTSAALVTVAPAVASPPALG